MNKHLKKWSTEQLLEEVKHDLGVAYIREQASEPIHWKEAVRKAIKDSGETQIAISKRCRHPSYYFSSYLASMTENCSLWRFIRVCKMAGLRVCVVNRKGHMFTVKHPGYRSAYTMGVRVSNQARPGDAEIFQ